MRRYKPDKPTRRYDLGFLPESWKMPEIASDQVIGAAKHRHILEHLVIGVAGNFKGTCRSHRIAVAPDELQQLPAQTLTDFELRAGQHPSGPARLTTGRLTVGKLKASDVLPSHSTLCAWSVRFAFEMALSVGRWNPRVE
jgi:hypothetical protein